MAAVLGEGAKPWHRQRTCPCLTKPPRAAGGTRRRLLGFLKASSVYVELSVQFTGLKAVVDLKQCSLCSGNFSALLEMGRNGTLRPDRWCVWQPKCALALVSFPSFEVGHLGLH